MLSLLLGLDAFGNHRQPQAAAEVDDHHGDGGASLGGLGLLDKGAVDLEAVHL